MGAGTLSSSPESSRQLRRVEELASLGCLLNALAHDLNNLLTNLLLAVEQAREEASPELMDLAISQARAMASVTERVHGLGHSLRGDAPEAVEVAGLLKEFSQWRSLVAPRATGVELDLADEPWVEGSRSAMLLALSLLADHWAMGPGDGPLRIRLDQVEVLRFPWGDPSDMRPMARIRLDRGQPPTDQTELPAGLLDRFFEEPRTGEEVALMAAWEVFRKVQGRPGARLQVFDGGDQGRGVEVLLPLADVAR